MYSSSDPFRCFILHLDADYEKADRTCADTLDSLLSRHGVRITYMDAPPSVIVNIFPRKLARNAGASRKPIYIDDENGHRICTVGDVRKMQHAGMNADEISKCLGINRSTYFRRKKDIRCKSDDSNF